MNENEGQLDEPFMRTLSLIAVLLLATTPALAHKDRIEPPLALAVGFKTGETATFTLSDGAIKSITLHVGSRDYDVPESECAKLRDVHFESAFLLWDGTVTSPAKAAYFYLEFEMGTATEKKFGELPQVQLMFRNGEFDEATVKKKTSEDTWKHSKL